MKTNEMHGNFALFTEMLVVEWYLRKIEVHSIIQFVVLVFFRMIQSSKVNFTDFVLQSRKF